MLFQQARYLKTRGLPGFSIGEVVLSMFILTAGLLSISALMASSIRNTFDINDTVIATGLAQEGIELVKNNRDNDFIMGSNGFAHFSAGKKHCRIDIDNVVTDDLDCTGNISSASSYTLTYQNGFYRHNNSASERFSRYVYIDYDASSQDTIVRSFVYWGGGTNDTFTPSSPIADCDVVKKCVMTETTLTDWKQ
ncbi:MAG: type IV pilus modification PilV family protein [Minisyncoccota bacterium]